MQTLKPKLAKININRASHVAVERIRGFKLQKIRQRILLRDEYTCQRCGRVTVDGEVDHIVPLVMGGSNSPLNLQYLCVDCHKIKSEEEAKQRE